MRAFCSTEHLNPEAIAAFADGELSRSASRRAMKHMLECPECFQDVLVQRRASARVKACKDDDLRAPDSLVAKLSGLCHEMQPAEPCGEDAHHKERSPIVAAVDATIRALRHRE